MARIVLAMIGSYGDLFPFIGLGVELKRRGHDVVLACPPLFDDLVTEAGLEFAPVGKPIGFEDFRDRPEMFRAGFGFRHVINEFLFDQIDEVTTDMVKATEGADFMVIHPVQLAAFSVAEAKKIPHVVASVFPGMIPSAHTVPGGLPFGPWKGSVGELANRTVWGVGYVTTGALFDRRLNRHRRNLGLDPVRSAWFKLPLQARAMIVMAPEALVRREPDWPDTVKMTSFVPWDHGTYRPVPPATEEFLAAGPPPVLITLGSSIAIRPEDTFEIATRAVTDHGERALVLTGPAPREAFPEPSELVHVAEFAPFGEVAPRCRAAVHHAGMGTTVSILNAGIPHITVPRGFDTPDRADMLEQIGVGIAVPWKQRRKRLAQAIDRVLIDHEMSVKAAEVAEKIKGIDGPAATADIIDEELRAVSGSETVSA